MRGREFIMKDAYSFDRDEAGAEESYRRMFEAYTRIFTRCGLRFSAVEADPGLIGGSFSHEFMVLADTGEEAITRCESCGYAAKVEKTPFSAETSGGERGPEVVELQKVFTPNLRTAEEVAAYLGSQLRDLAKTLIYRADGDLWAVLIPGDRQVNELKLRNSLGAGDVSLAEAETIEAVTGAPVGFAGPIGLKDIPILADYTLLGRENLVVGANEADYHYQGAKPGRDFEIQRYLDLRMAQEGDPCPRCGRPLGLRRGIEVGHVFKLGTKYSQALGATVLNERGQERLAVMGCYGIGIGRTIAAAIEQNHDERGILWPMPLAPFQAIVIPVNTEVPAVTKAAEDLYGGLEAEGVETLLDDRDERPGVKFKDAELIGIPLQVIVGIRNLESGKVELKRRRDGAPSLLPLEEVTPSVLQMVKESLASGPSDAFSERP
jgi:prolyl-tRNA synthetase